MQKRSCCRRSTDWKKHRHGIGSRSAKRERADSFRGVRFWKRCCQRCARWNRLCWRGIFHGSWENKSKFQMGGLRKNGGLPLFSPEGRTYSPPVKQAVVCLRHRALSEGDCGFCGSLQTMPQHLRVLLSSSARLGKYRRFNRRYFPTACANLPPAALPQRWTGVQPVHFLFCERETEKERTR